MAQSPTEYAVGSSITFVVGPTRIRDTAEVTGHEGQFIVTKNSSGRVRKVRPGSVEK